MMRVICYRHGTRVAGVIAAKMNFNFSVGIAFGSEIAGMAVLYKNRRCGMIVHETATHQMPIEFKLLQVPVRPSIMN